MEEWVDELQASTGEFAAVLAWGDLAVAVPTCPGWNLAQLGEHLGGIHQWAAHAITHGSPDGEVTAAPADRDGLVAWYTASAAHLIDVLAATPPDAPAWNFGPKPRVARFWGRRQVHETDMHLLDAAASQGITGRLDVARALDGLDEVCSMFFPRQLRLGRIPPLNGTFILETDGGSFVFGGASPAPAARVHGPPDALLLLVWKRIGLDDVRLQVTGDPEWAVSVLKQALTP